MRVLAVDDEALMLEKLCDSIKEAAPEAVIASFRRASEAQEYIQENEIDVAFLDIKMRGMTGMELAKIIKTTQPNVNIIFCTGYSEYMYDAISKVRCSGYILKPVDAGQVAEELKNLRIPMKKEADKKGLYVQCFGNFEVFLNDEILKFESKKTKELFAYLVDRHGALCNIKEIEAVLWEDDGDHSSYIKKCRKELTDLFKAKGLEDVIEKTWGGLAVRAGHFQCDYYDWIDGKAEGINRWNGSYMDQYSWAEVTKASLMDF